MAQDKWVVSHEAMPSNITTGNQLLEEIHGQLVELLKVPEEWGVAIQGVVDSQNKNLVQKVGNVVNMTNAAFGASQEANSFANLLLENGLTEQLDEATNATESTTDNPVKWAAL